MRAQWVKDNQRLLEVQRQYERDMEAMHGERVRLKKEVIGLKLALRQKEQEHQQQEQEAKRETKREIALKEELERVKEEGKLEQNRRQQLEKGLESRKRECDELERELNQQQLQHDKETQQITKNHEIDLKRLQQDNADLRKRNENLEHSLMEHLSQTAQSIQQGLRATQDKSLRNTTLPLPESPIRARSRPRERTDTIISREEDPEKVPMENDYK